MTIGRVVAPGCVPHNTHKHTKKPHRNTPQQRSEHRTDRTRFSPIFCVSSTITCQTHKCQLIRMCLEKITGLYLLPNTTKQEASTYCPTRTQTPHPILNRGLSSTHQQLEPFSHTQHTFWSYHGISTSRHASACCNVAYLRSTERAHGGPRRSTRAMHT